MATEHRWTWLARWARAKALRFGVAIALATAALVAPAPTRDLDLAATSAFASAPAPAQTETQTEEILSRVSAVRSLEVKGEVPVGTVSREEYRAELAEQFKEEDASEDIENSRAVYVLLDLLTEEDDLPGLVEGLLGEQVAGYYNLRTHEMKLVTAGDALSVMDELTLSHEYVHALQDQHFDLGASLEAAEGPGEKVSALKALSEGDATLAMVLYARRHMTEEQMAEIGEQSGELDSQKLNAAPLVLQRSLLFPYERGTTFVAFLYGAGGWPMVDSAYSKPPTTSEQIMHPEKYLRGEGPMPVEAPEVAPLLGPDWSLVDDDVLGELGMQIYLENQLPRNQAATAAAGWGGDRTMLLRNEAGQSALVVLSRWDTPRDAAEFYSAVRELRSPKMSGKLAEPDDTHLLWSGPSMSRYAALAGNWVVLVIAPDDATAQRAGEALAAE